MSEETVDPYVLARSAIESKRLEVQHVFCVKCQGYDIHPNILQKLPAAGEKLRIADVGTGTGIFLRHLSEKPEFANASFDGFDISTEQFPPAESLPRNVQLKTQDAKVVLPLEYHGQYDIVHVRLLQAGLASEDWTTVARNLLQLLKPGGALQWVEYDQSLIRKVTFANAQGTKQYLQQWVNSFTNLLQNADPVKPDFDLAKHVKEAGYVNVIDERYSSDVNEEIRAAHTENFKLAIYSLPAVMKLIGVPEDDYTAFSNGVIRDLDSGSFARLDVIVAIGWK